jgi:hypothetical protein
MADPKTPAKGAAPKATPAPAAAAAKSIVDAKYRDRYKEPDWLGKLLADHATATKKVQKTEVDPENPDAKVTKTVDVPDGVNVDALFKIAKMNGLTDKVSKFEAQRDGHGFGGRFRMTVRNLLQARIKRAHGLFLPGDGGKPEWVSADKAWLSAKGAPDKPTHNQDGSKIAPPKAAAKEEAAPAADAKADGKKAK